MRVLATIAFACLSLPALADLQFSPVPVGGVLQAEFRLTDAGGHSIVGIQVALSVPYGCGQVAPSQVTTDVSGTGRFQFFAGNSPGVCVIDGKSGSTTVTGRTTVYQPADVQIDGALDFVRFGTSTGIFILTVRAAGLPLGLLPIEVGQFPAGGPQLLSGRGSPVLSDSVVTTDASGRVTLLSSGVTPGIHDLPIRIGGVEHRLRVYQYPAPFVDTAWDQYVQNAPWDKVHVVLSDGPASNCLMGSVVPDPLQGPLPPGIVDWFGPMLNINFQCPGAPTPTRVRVDYPDALPEDGQLWLQPYIPGPGAPWKVLPAVINGNSISFTLSEFSSNPQDPSHTFYARLGVGRPGSGTPPPPLRVQDMWWAGPAENGWGMSIVQEADYPAIFAAIYGYDKTGEPTWWVMPQGDWRTARGQQFDAAAYSPIGTPWYAYDASILVVPEPGRVVLRFSDAGHAEMDYNIDGVTGHKAIQRQAFGNGPASPGRPAAAGMWWGGASQNGWGMAVTQQGDKLFNVWYTYDAEGVPRWYVMPSGSWSGPATYEGPIYRTRGSPWLGPTYDPRALQANDVGSFSMTFSGTSATFAYSLEGRTGALSLVRMAPF